MGTQILGSQTGGNSVQFYFNSASNTALKGVNNVATTPGDIYVDSIVVFAGTSSGGASLAFCALYTTGNVLVCQTAALTISNVKWSGQGLSPFHITGGVQLLGAILGTNQGIRTWGLNDGGGFAVLGTSGSFPSTWSGGSLQSGLGNLGWYATYFPACTISGISPVHAQEGATVNVFGQSFSAGVNSVTVNGTGASFGYVNDGQINVTVPSGATSGAIVVNTNAGSGTSGTLTIDPTISSISPTHGAPGNSVTISGSGFFGVTNVQFTSGVSATFGVNSDSQIVTTVPSGAVTGSIQVQKPSAIFPNSSTFTVDSTLTSFTPTFGGVGTSVTLTGVGFTGATAVAFNGTSASFTVNSDTQITTTVPSGATTGIISVTCTGGTISSGSNFIMASGWFHSSGTLHHFQGIWYKHGGILNPIKGAWFHEGGVISPLK